LQELATVAAPACGGLAAVRHQTFVYMHTLYSKALVRLVLLLGMSMLIGYLCVSRSYHHTPLFGQEEFSWQLRKWNSGSDAASALNAKVDGSRLIMEFVLSGSNPSPHASTALLFTDRNGKPTLLDWSRYGKISFEARCFS
jgi:hypothetical protein